jgi:hypothetical protein
MQERKWRAGIASSPFYLAENCNQAADFIGMHIIIMPPQFIIIGMPICVMPIMLSQHFMNMSFMEASMGIISQVMPLAVMVHFIWQLIIGIIDIALAIMGFIMPAIIGFIIPPDIIGFIMPPIIMGIGIICIAGFIIILQKSLARSCYLAHVWETSRVVVVCNCRTRYLFSFVQEDDRTADETIEISAILDIMPTLQI